jgi:hypothetical protein
MYVYDLVGIATVQGMTCGELTRVASSHMQTHCSGNRNAINSCNVGFNAGINYICQALGGGPSVNCFHDTSGPSIDAAKFTACKTQQKAMPRPLAYHVCLKAFQSAADEGCSLLSAAADPEAIAEAERAADIKEQNRIAQEQALAEEQKRLAEEAARLEAEAKIAEEAARLDAEKAAVLEAEARLVAEAARLEAEKAAALEAEARLVAEAARTEAEKAAAVQAEIEATQSATTNAEGNGQGETSKAEL